MKFVNLTPHEVRVFLEEGVSTRLAPSGQIARVLATTSDAGHFGNVPLVKTSFGEVSGLPDSEKGTLYIVSAMVRMALPSRKDLASPGDLVRDESGNVIGCRNLIVS